MMVVTMFAGFASSADAAAKAGDTCAVTEVGKTKDGLTCVKTGAKRVWTRAPTAKAGPTSSVPSAAKKEPIALGVALGQTGTTTANLAQDQTIAVKLAEKYFNENGGINGRPLKLVIHDTGSDDAGAVSAFKSLIANDHVVGIVGPTLSQQAFVADVVAEQAKVPVIGPSNTAANIPQIGDYVARVSAGVARYAGSAIKYAATLQPIDKAALFFAQDDAFSRSEAAVFESAAKNLGIQVLPPQTFNAAETNFGNQTDFVVGNRPDLVIISGLATAGHLVKQLRDTGYAGLIVGGNGLNVVQTFSVCKAQCDGLIVAQAYSPEIPAAGINAEWRKLFKAEQQREPGQIAAQAFTAVQVFVEALRATDKAGKLTGSLDAVRIEVNKNILSGEYATPLGDISFDSSGEIQQKNFYVAQIKMRRGDAGDPVSGKFVYAKV
jgi:branched-chain amino acid transport system substrate-binding protein